MAQGFPVPPAGSGSFPTIPPVPQMPSTSNFPATPSGPGGFPVLPGVGTQPASDSPDPPNYTTKGTRTDADVKPPQKEDPNHKDYDIHVGTETIRMRWDPNLGYVAIGQGHDSQPIHVWNDQEFREYNKGQLDPYGGGQIPPATTDHPEYFGPEVNGQSLIYHYDPKSGKNVIVGWRQDGHCHYVQSVASMDVLNKTAAQGGLGAPPPPLKPPSTTIPYGDAVHDGHLEQYGTAQNDPNGKNYIWRWDSKAGRYCAVAEGTKDHPGQFDWYTNDEYVQHNSGDNALVMNGDAAMAPTRDDSRGETIGTGDQISYIADDAAGTKGGDGHKVWGQPIYWYDRNSGHKVCVGVQVTNDNGSKSNYYFDKDHMQKYNNYETIGTETFWVAKPEKDFPKDNHRAAPEPDPFIASHPDFDHWKNDANHTEGYYDRSGTWHTSLPKQPVGCVHVDSVLPDGRRAADIEVGDVIQLGDEGTRALETRVGVVTYSKRIPARGFRIVTQSGITLLCSDTAPIWTDEGFVLAPDLLARKVATRLDGTNIMTRFETVEVVAEIGMIEVQHITVGDRSFWAGAERGAYILHHNKPMP